MGANNLPQALGFLREFFKEVPSGGPRYQALAIADRCLLVRHAMLLLEEQDPVSEGVLSGANLAGLTWQQIEEKAVRDALVACGGNRERAAQMLGIGERTMYRKIKQYQIEGG